MCHLCVVNTNEEYLNKELLTIMGEIGSATQDDGWGVFDGNRWWKSGNPFYFTSNAGDVIRRELSRTGKKPLALHLRQASPQVPVCHENSHPFSHENFTFAHNGKLVPKEEKNFVMEEEVPDFDDKTGEQRKDAKTGELKTKKVKRSDSLIFFEHFISVWENASEEDRNVETILPRTMEDFTGKFAFILHTGTKLYVVKGRSADLHISYLREKAPENSQVTGYVINTNKESLFHSLLISSNLRQISGNGQLHFSMPKPLEDETIFLVEKTELKPVGKIKENYTPVTTQYWRGRDGVAGGQNFTHTTRDTTGSTSEINRQGPVEKLTRKIFNFMVDYSLSPADIQNMLLTYYEASLQEIELPILEHFANKVIPSIASKVKKKVRKEVYKICAGFPVPTAVYFEGVNYPWMFGSREDQAEFLRLLRKQKDEK